MDIYYILLILYFIFFLSLTLKNLKWAIYLIIFGLPSYLIRFEIGGLPMTVLEGMILLIFFIWFVKTLKNKEIKKLKQLFFKYKFLFIVTELFLLSATVAMFVAPELRVAAGIWKAYFIEPILFLIIFIDIIKKEDFKILFKILFWQVGLLSIVAIYQKITGNLIANLWWAAEATRRVTSVFEYPNALALYLSPIIIILMGYLVYSIKSLLLNKDKKRILEFGYGVLIIIISIGVIYFTKSKGALLGILSGILFYIFFCKGLKKYFIGILLIIILLGGYAIQSGKINLKGSSTVIGGDSISVRLDMWQETWQMLKVRPILGAGLVGYQTIMRSYHQRDYIEIYLYPHNIFLNFWSELGILGLISFLIIIGWFYQTGLKKKVLAISYQLSIILMAAMTTLLVHGLVDVPYFKNDLSILFWFLIGMMLILNKQ